MSEKIACPPRATACWENSKMSIWANCLTSRSLIPSRYGAKNRFTASHPMAPAKLDWRAAENFIMCARSTSGCLAGRALARLLGRLSPNFLRYSRLWPEQYGRSMNPRSCRCTSPRMWASATSWLNTASSAYSFLMFSARVRLVASGPWGTLAFSRFGCTRSSSTSKSGIPSRVCMRRALSKPSSISLASTSSRMRGAVSTSMRERWITPSTASATWRALSSSR